MPLSFTIVYLIWFVSELGLSLWMRSATADKKADRNSLRLLWVVIVISIQVAIFTSFNLILPITAWLYFKYAGLALLIAGISFRIFAIASLGKMFTVDVTIRQGHALKQDGIYKYLRHPSYTGSLLSFLGFAFTLNNWASLFIVMMPVASVFLWRIRIEEAALTEAFAPAYGEYKKRTAALIPFIY